MPRNARDFLSCNNVFMTVAERMMQLQRQRLLVRSNVLYYIITDILYLCYGDVNTVVHVQ